ncbi:hypothetical protein L6164_017252 [Bauhinia variegata]|uniref:Uncharacterized protein n=1 Tax=Bauhinia variegata TaxID=167791 RepID=A0ACB9N7H8_BAUVA|nr:hypothetical protein L6164_017252 [Bauhinia variegata]
MAQKSVHVEFPPAISSLFINKKLIRKNIKQKKHLFYQKKHLVSNIKIVVHHNKLVTMILGWNIDTITSIDHGTFILFLISELQPELSSRYLTDRNKVIMLFSMSI